MLKQAYTNYLASRHLPSELPPFGDRWEHKRQEMADAITHFRSAEEAIAYGQLETGFDHRGMITEADIPKLQIAEQLLRGLYPKFRNDIALFSDTPVTTPGTAIKLNGRLASHILYFHAFYLLTCFYYRRDIDSVCEVGGGYGNPAVLWLTNPIRRVQRYVIVDLPESLFFAEIFLRKALPDVPLHYASEAFPAAAAPGITLVPIQLASQTNQLPFDLIANTGSMSEMSDDWVQFWCDWLGQQNSTLFYSHNMMGNPAGLLLEARARFAPRVPSDWAPVYVKGVHPLVLLVTDQHKMAEVIFERGLPRENTAMRPATYEGYVYSLYTAAFHDPSFRAWACDFFGYEPTELTAG
jgi:hypothetical protein